MTRDELEAIRQWAVRKLAEGQEPPWAWYRYMQLADALEHIVRGMDSTVALKEKPKLTVVLPA